MSEQKIGLGDLVRDRVTGFEGIVVARTEWLNGCARLTVQPQKLDEKGKPVEADSFDDMQCVVLERERISTVQTDTGGPRETPKRPAASSSRARASVRRGAAA
jgi:hypothetical protein